MSRKLKFSKYLLGGVVGYPLKLGLTALLTEWFSIYYVLSYIITQVVMMVYFFCYNFFIAFESKQKKMHTLMLYLLSYVFFAAIDVYLVKLITEAFSVYYLLSIILTTAIIVVVKFFVYDALIFNTNDWVARILKNQRKQ